MEIEDVRPLPFGTGFADVAGKANRDDPELSSARASVHEHLVVFARARRALVEASMPGALEMPGAK